MMYEAAAGLGLVGWNVGHTLTVDDVAMIQTMQDNVKDQSTMYAACKAQQPYWAAGIVAAAAVGYFIGKAMK